MNVSAGGIVYRIDTLREEARKCVLLCSNCHAEVEAGAVALPLHLAERTADRDSLEVAGSIYRDPG